MSDYCTRKSCRYWADHRYNTANSCDYLMLTGKSRIAQIPDKAMRRNFDACPCYERGKKDRTRPLLPFEMQTTYNWSLGRKLYNAGASDRKIAAALGCSRAAVRYWRGRHKLPATRKGDEP